MTSPVHRDSQTSHQDGRLDNLSVKNQIDSLLNEALETRVKNIEGSVHLAKEAMHTAMDLKDASRIAKAKNYLGLFHMIRGENPEAIEITEQAIKYYRKKPNSKGEAFGLYTLGSVYYKTANHVKGLELLLESLKIWQIVGDKSNESRTLKAIGYIYEIFDDYENAVKNYLHCMEISKEIGDKNGESNACNPLSGIYLRQGELEKADELIKRSLRLKMETGDIRGLAFAYFGKGKVLFAQEKYQESEEFIIKSLQIHVEMGEHMGEGMAKKKLGKIYLAMGDIKRSEYNTKMALEIGERIKNYDLIYESLFDLYIIAKRKKQIPQALKYFERFHEVKETVLNVEASGKIKAREAIHNLELSRKESEIERLKNIELKKAHDEIELKNKQIGQSIRYAQRIQQNILPSEKRWKKEFPLSFKIYRPKDVVSGDIYWMKKKGKKVLFSVIDCTGHGVPGALVSMVGYSGLNQLVEQFDLTTPGNMLDKLCHFIKLAFKSEFHEIQDGMDMSLCCFDQPNFTLEFAGANNPIYLIRKGVLTQHNANKQSIGYSADHEPFSNKKIKLEHKDRIYLFSDGYADQFGGPQIKKFTSRAFKEMLVEIQDQDMQKQGEIINQKFKDWQGDQIQIDDVCVIGIEFNKNKFSN